ncbi:MAG: hypothetical protein BWY71_01749 [Planctomycetes bacterium ADurb.Bin412]|nr:MAG: hypothetical protein BWY71_01749 [Planctomycetes bacterium ADurb.Bin412]
MRKFLRISQLIGIRAGLHIHIRDTEIIAGPNYQRHRLQSRQGEIPARPFDQHRRPLVFRHQQGNRL